MLFVIEGEIFIEHDTVIALQWGRGASQRLEPGEGTPREAATRDQLQRLLKTYDLSPWFFTKALVIDEKAIPFSHPVLTLRRY